MLRLYFCSLPLNNSFCTDVGALVTPFPPPPSPLPPLTEAHFDFPSVKPVFFGGGEGNSVEEDFTDAFEEYQGENEYEYGEPNYRPPIRDLSRGYLRSSRQQQRQQQRHRSRDRSFDVETDPDPFTSPGPPYGVAVTPAQFTVVSPPSPPPPPPPPPQPPSPSPSPPSHPTISPPVQPPPPPTFLPTRYRITFPLIFFVK